MDEIFDFRTVNVDTMKVWHAEIVEKAKECNDAVVAVENQRTFENTVFPGIKLGAELATKTSVWSFAKNFYTEKEIRDEATRITGELQVFYIEQSQRKDLYEAYKAYEKVFEEEKKNLTHEERRYFEHAMRDYKRAGLELKEGKERDDFIAMKKELSDICLNFSKNVNDVDTSFEYTKEQLNGMPDSWFEDSKKIEGKENTYKVTLKYPDYYPAMKYAKNREVRKTLKMAYQNRCPENQPLFKRAVILREKMAKILGYADHADYRCEVKIVKSGKNALDFTENLNKLFTGMFRDDIKNLEEFAKAFKEDPLEGALEIWDRAYYVRALKEEQCQIDLEACKQYFPIDVVKKGLFAIYQDLLGVDFKTIETTNKWHESVDLFSVTDKESGDLMGYVYLDMHPRDGKYGHAAAFDFVSSCDMSKINGETTRRATVMCMVCNFPSNGCIPHSDVVTFFHEFGHIMHNICSKPQLASFSGFGVEWDFVEAPSQMLENWCYCEEPLKLMSAHIETGKPIPQEMIQSLKKIKNSLSGYGNKGQFMYALFDLRVHTMTFESEKDEADFNPQAVWRQVCQEVLEYDCGTDIHPYASFGHLMGGYDAGYYGYKRAETYSANMFQLIFAKDPLSKEAGMRYRRKICEPGSTKDGIDMLRDFLGEEPDDKYFLIDQGLKVE